MLAVASLVFCTIYLYGDKSYMKNLQTIQNKAVKDHATPYFIKFEILKIQDIYQLEIAKLVFRHMYPNSLLTFTIFRKVDEIIN